MRLTLVYFSCCHGYFLIPSWYFQISDHSFSPSLFWCAPTHHPRVLVSLWRSKKGTRRGPMSVETQEDTFSSWHLMPARACDVDDLFNVIPRKKCSEDEFYQELLKPWPTCSLPWEQVGQILSHLQSGISGTLQRVSEGTEHRSPDSAGTYSSTLQLSYLRQHSIFGTEVTCYKIGGEVKK